MSDVYTRRDGVKIPELLMMDLRSVWLTDIGTPPSDKTLSEEYVLTVPWRDRPADHPQAYPRLVPSERMTAEQIKAFTEPQWRHFNAREDQECPNCLGKKGEGKFWARTGDRDTRLYSDIRPRRKLTSYDCPVCASQRGEGSLDAVLRCGISPEVLLKRSDDEMWWGLKDDEGQSRAPVEAVVKAAVEAALKRGGGMFSVAGAPGTGRSFLLEWATGKIANAGVRCRYIRYDEYEQLIAEHIKGGDFAATPAIVDTMSSVPALIIDQFEQAVEVNAKGEQNFAARQMRNIIHARYRSWKEGRPAVTLIAVNLTAWNAGGRDVLLDVYDRLRDGVYAASEMTGLRRALGTNLALFEEDDNDQQ